KLIVAGSECDAVWLEPFGQPNRILSTHGVGHYLEIIRADETYLAQCRRCGVHRDCGDAGAVGGKAKRHNFHAVELLRLLEQLSESVSLHLEQGTFGLAQARIDKHNPV